MARTVLVSLAPAAVIAAAWLRLESPREAILRAVVLAALALAVAVVRPLAARLATLVAAGALAAWLAFSLSPFDARPFDSRHDFFGQLGSRFSSGFSDFYDVRLPFDPRVHAAMHEDVLAAVFVFTLALALAIAARRPLVAALVLVAGAGWPATLAGSAGGLVEGAAILLAALALLAGLSARRLPSVAVPAAAVLALVAVGAASTAAVAKPGLVAWQRWRLSAAPPAPVSVQFVWDGRYAGISFPRKKTTVLEVQAPKSASLYWRAAVLDDFDGAGWVGVGAGPGDALEPPAAYVARNQTTQVVTVRALSDTRLVGGSTPIAFDVGSAPVVSPAPGFAFLPAGLTRDFRYTARSYAPQPTAAMLERSPAAYPRVLTSPGAFLDVSPGVTMPPFGAPARAARVSRIVARPGLHAYTGLAQTAATVVRKARTPYEAAVALEAWFRAPGRFRYSNHPPYDPAAPLAAFVTRTRVGYCQYFAGAMALMLRYAGVPARVAVGFSSGRYDAQKRAWVVTDHDAHAWVEAWFAGYGWLPFDPTPSAGRPEQGALSARYSASSPGFDLRRATGGELTGSAAAPAHAPKGQRAGAGTGANVAARRAPSRLRRGLRAVLLLLLIAAAALAALAALKAVVRRLRFRTDDPRALASACRGALAGFLLDQRIEAASSATLQELGAVVRRTFAADAGPFVAATDAARFGPPAGAPAAAQEARRELGRLLGEMRARLSGRERLRGLLSLRSLVPDGSRLDVSA